MTVPSRLQALGGLVLGAVVLILVTALLSAAVTTSQVADDLKHATNQLKDIRKADAKSEAERVKSRAAMAEQLTALRRRSAEQLAYAKAQRRYLAELSRTLRTHGIPVPSPPKVTVTVSPKAPRRNHHNQGNPAPTAPAPSPESALCQLAPALCTGLPLGLPTLLP